MSIDSEEFERRLDDMAARFNGGLSSLAQFNVSMWVTALLLIEARAKISRHDVVKFLSSRRDAVPTREVAPPSEIEKQLLDAIIKQLDKEPPAPAWKPTIVVDNEKPE